jgi:hypothetical protein
MGAATAGAVGVSVKTSLDTLSSTFVSSGSILVTAVVFTLSQIHQVAASQATISFGTTESIPSGGSITMRFPFGRYGNGTMSVLGIMDGWSIGAKPLHAG